ncbi:hypothetical protein [Nitrosomonas sp. Nm34]|uniref:hypothetical protein n=1 Tax=Nitrosomonas sp. Nm34 TaxID=1881055 RepID=UPI0008E40023|nr:hypothetical protein [Nitrosomonas sp. Nm34]SFI24846.1 hypothetical protein SAMN05428978_100342 [Nitrosomonas sp. Nm34]
MLESSFRLGTIFGIRIGVHYMWFIVFFLLISSLFVVFRNPIQNGAVMTHF